MTGPGLLGRRPILGSLNGGRATVYSAPTATGQYVVRVGLALSETELDISTQEPIKL